MFTSDRLLINEVVAGNTGMSNEDNRVNKAITYLESELR
jgi:hypothetical protein